MTTDVELYKRQFYDEARDILEKANDDLLRVEADPGNEEILNSIFRGVHTIKGSAGTFDLGEISEFTHGLEGLLDALRNGRLLLKPDIVDVILEGFDHISLMIETLADGGEACVDRTLMRRFKDICERNQAVKKSSESAVHKGETKRPEPSPAVPRRLKEQFRAHSSKGLNIYRIKVNYTSDVFRNGFDPLVLLRNLRESSKFYYVEPYEHTVPVLSKFKALDLCLKPTIYVATDAGLEELKNLSFDPSLIEIRKLRISDEKTDGEKTCSGKEGIDKDLLKEFLIGSSDMLESMERAIMHYEKTDSQDALNEVFRAVHTIKGDAGCTGLKGLKEVAHSLETLLERLRKGEIKRSPEIVDTLLAGTDAFKEMISGIENNMHVSHHSIQDRICRHLGEKDEAVAGRVSLLPDGSEKVFLMQARQYIDILRDNIKPLPLDSCRAKIVRRALEGLDKAASFMKIGELNILIQKALGTIGGTDDTLVLKAVEDISIFIEGVGKGRLRLGEILVRDGKVSEKDVRDALSRQEKIGRILTDENNVGEKDMGEAVRKHEIMDRAGRARSSATPETRTMRVEESKIERLSDMTGELLVSKNTFEHLISQIASKGKVTPSMIKSLKDNMYLLARVTNDMHHGVMSLRMVPVKSIFQKFSRVVRDISRKQNKMIDFITEGDDTEVDKQVADKLSDPLIHLVRNACDHGIEGPDERRAAGKPERGNVILYASQEGSNLVIRVTDDGRGVNREKLFEKAKSMGFDADSPDDDNLLDYIFMPGISTKKEVTDVSGRGVGMDVVKTAVLSLGGDVGVVSEEGNGSEITLSIPTTMGINDALLVEADGKLYALPLDYVVETVKITTNKLRKHRNNILFHCRNEVLHAVRLGDMLSGTGNGRDKLKNDVEIPVVILKTGTAKFALVVDRLHKKMELAVKPVPDSLSMIDIIGGVSILGDGSVVLILNPERLFRSAGGGNQ